MKRLVFALIAVFALVAVVSADTAEIHPFSEWKMGIVGNNVFSTLRATASASYYDTGPSTNANFNIRASTTTNQYLILGREFYIINSSVIPEGVTITNVSFNTYKQSSSSALGNAGAGITGFTQAGDLSADDFNNFLDTRYATDIALDSLSSGWNTWYFNAVGIENVSTTGNTTLVGRLSWDIDNGTGLPWISDAESIYTPRGIAYSGTTYDPYLSVTYYATPTASFTTSDTRVGASPLSITFSSAASTGTPTDWDWYFWANETKSSDDQNPTASFTTGVYNIRLYASNPAGGDWENKTAYITSLGGAAPYAYFTGTPLTGTPGLLVSFSPDTSVYGNSSGCNWSFGDFTSVQPYSATCGDTQHVYAYSGVYSINFSITNDNGTSYLLRSEYVVVSPDQTPSYILPTQPKSVRFKIVDAYGTELPGATVSASYIASSLPTTDTNWLVSAFGVSETVANEMLNGSISQSGLTGDDGSLSFIMYPVIQYGLVISNATAGLNNYKTIYPKDDDYIIYCTLTSQVAPVSKLTTLANSTIYITEPNSSFVTFHVVYQDPSDDTTNIKWNVTCLTNGTVMYTKDFGDPGTSIQLDNYTVSTSPRGYEYRAMYDATRDV